MCAGGTRLIGPGDGVAMPASTRRRRVGEQARVVPQHPHPVGDWKVVALRLAGGAVVLWGLFSLIGMLVTHVLVRGPVQSVDRGVEVWFAARQAVLIVPPGRRRRW